jgi:hypothetical protein
MRLKNIAIAVLLLALIVAAVAITLTRVRNETKQQPTYLQLENNKLVPKIDMNSLEVFSETDSDWYSKYAPDQSGRFKNPKTGEYTVVEPMTCASCGQLIPTPADMPPQPHPFLGRGKIDVQGAVAAAKAIMAFKLTYKCPRCGKPAFPPPTSRPQFPSSTPTTTTTPSPAKSK